MDVGIGAISVHLPAKRVSNEDLMIEFPDWNGSKSHRKTGIRERRVTEGELASDMAVEAAERLFRDYSIDRSDVDFLLLCTQTPDYLCPPTSCIVQQRLGLSTSIGAFDLNQGCTGYVYSLALCKSMIDSGVADNVLLITSDMPTRRIHRGDMSGRALAGDAATATLVTSEAAGGRIGQFVLGTDGSGAANLIVPAGGTVLPKPEETAREAEDGTGNVRSRNDMFMNGPAIFEFAMNVVPGLVDRTLDVHGLRLDDVDLFIFHQANRMILETLRVMIDIPRDKMFLCMETTGNMSSSIIPIALCGAEDKGLLHSGARVMITAFGGGYSWGSTMLEW